MEHVFCTVLSRFRAYQALALLWSLEQVGMPQRFYILCVDEQTLRLLKAMRLKRVVSLSLEDISNAELEDLKKSRKLNEYCWTLKPVLIESLFKRFPEIVRVTYLDADLFFYRNPEVVFHNQPDASVLLTRGEIAIPQMSKPSERVFQSMMGDYNSGFISFKRDDDGLACLAWWREKCMDSCVSQPREGKFGDQKYLEEMAFLFKNVAEVTTPGVNIGHWNSEKHRFRAYEGYLYIDRYRLICYHFSGYRILSKNNIVQIFEQNRAGRPFFYNDYSSVLKSIIEAVERIDPQFSGYSNEEI